MVSYLIWLINLVDMMKNVVKQKGFLFKVIYSASKKQFEFHLPLIFLYK